METIAAIATPPAVGGIAVIRISGADALAVAERVFRPVGERAVAGMDGYTAAYGAFYDGETRLDDGVLLVFRAPRSYTGENVAELSCHGGLYLSRRVLAACFKAGARPAQAGEFTKRALLNGKLSLTQAEAVADLIGAQNEQYLFCARAQREGALYRRLRAVSERLLDFSSLVGAWIDYPDEMEDEFDPAREAEKLSAALAELDRLLKSYDEGRLLREGISCAIVGRPNAGKSTLMNRLSGRERSIVTEIEGTTRDIVEETVLLGGVPLRLSDCAGYRETEDRVERLGIEKMLNEIENAELVLAVFDGSRALNRDDERLLDRLAGKKCICIVNKADLPTEIDLTRLRERFPYLLTLSAKTGEGGEALADLVKEAAGLAKADLYSGFIANERQRGCLREARDSTARAVEALKEGVTPDAVGVLAENALSRLYELSGESVSETVIDEVFKRFCVGK
ncbi:MAG: tRNA uridine-5-carboxymethylaminomethyl(34) synthesis GTPase MnmE [Bacteroides sp.]|nr:tRNA uridine-5-carboxymethylaminomethyl(34) synthesis GTPase MnmE [Eubacterium sp.]MCM1419035.1 tRNA uridine-5-carboxymethylaminomethyl(34) synthesis GTPase MnmE [Roseburia sp.]MCM1463399.1 tRNA uridine-5-carboxymethylaminomethyl(34) synthesis GTPase MnmE [Bacteroides sp.]